MMPIDGEMGAFALMAQRPRRRTSPIKFVESVGVQGQRRQRATVECVFPPDGALELLLGHGHGLVHVFTPTSRNEDSINDKIPWWQLDEGLLSRLETTLDEACKPIILDDQVETTTGGEGKQGWSISHEHHLVNDGALGGIQLQSGGPKGPHTTGPLEPNSAFEDAQLGCRNDEYDHTTISKQHQGLYTPGESSRTTSQGSSASLQPKAPAAPTIGPAAKAGGLNSSVSGVYASRLDRISPGMPKPAVSGAGTHAATRLFHMPDEECQYFARQQLLTSASGLACQGGPHLPPPAPSIDWHTLQRDRQHIVNVAATALKLHMQHDPGSMESTPGVVPSRVVAFAGLPGVGKSCVMLHTARALMDRADQCTGRSAPAWQQAFYADLQHTQDVESAACEILASLGAQPSSLPGTPGWRHLLGSWLHAKHAQTESVFGSMPAGVVRQAFSFPQAAVPSKGAAAQSAWRGWWGLVLDGTDHLNADQLDHLIEVLVLACPSMQVLVSHSTWGCSASDPFGHIPNTQSDHGCDVRQWQWRQGVRAAIAWVPSLPEHAAWQLFCSTTQVSSNNVQLARQLCAGCAGLPRAIAMLAGLPGWAGSQPPAHAAELLPRLVKLAHACRGTAPDDTANEMSVWSSQEHEVIAATSDVLHMSRDQHDYLAAQARSLCKLVTQAVLASLPTQLICALEALASFSYSWCDVQAARALVEAPTVSHVHVAGSATKVLNRLRELGLLSWHPGSRTFIRDAQLTDYINTANPGGTGTGRRPAGMATAAYRTSMSVSGDVLFGTLASPRADQPVPTDEFAIRDREHGLLPYRQGPACVMVTQAVRQVLHEELPTTAALIQAHHGNTHPPVDPGDTSTAAHEVIDNAECYRVEARIRGMSAALAGTPWLMTTASHSTPSWPTPPSEQRPALAGERIHVEAGISATGVGRMLLSAAQGFYSGSWTSSIHQIVECVRRLHVLLDSCQRCTHLGQLLPSKAMSCMADAVWQLRDVLPQVMSRQHLHSLIVNLKSWARSKVETSMSVASCFIRMDLLLCQLDGSSAALRCSVQQAQNAVTFMTGQLDQEEQEKSHVVHVSAYSVSEGSPDDLHALHKTLQAHLNHSGSAVDEHSLVMQAKVTAAVQGLQRGVKALVRLHGHSHPHTLAALTMYLGLLGSQSHVSCKKPCSDALGFLAKSANDIPALLKAWDACTLPTGIDASASQGRGGDETDLDQLIEDCSGQEGTQDQAEHFALMILEAVALKTMPVTRAQDSTLSPAQHQSLKSAAEAHAFLAELRQQQGCWELAITHWQACQQLWSSMLTCSEPRGQYLASGPTHPQLAHVKQQLLCCASAVADWSLASQMCEELATDMLNHTCGPYHSVGVQAVLAQVAAHLHVGQDNGCIPPADDSTATSLHPEQDTQLLIQCTRLLGICEWILEQQPLASMCGPAAGDDGADRFRDGWQACQALECKAELLRLQALTLKALCQDAQALQTLDASVAAIEHALHCGHAQLHEQPRRSQDVHSCTEANPAGCPANAPEGMPMCASWCWPNWGTSLLHKLAAVHEARGVILQDLAAYPSAHIAFRMALHFRLMAAGPRHPCVAHTLMLLADCHMAGSRHLVAMQGYSSACYVLHQHMLRLPRPSTTAAAQSSSCGTPEPGDATSDQPPVTPEPADTTTAQSPVPPEPADTTTAQPPVTPDPPTSKATAATVDPCMAACLRMKAALFIRMSKALQQQELLQEAAQHAQHAVGVLASLVAACTVQGMGTLTRPVTHPFTKLEDRLTEAEEESTQMRLTLHMARAHLQLASVIEQFGDAEKAVQQYRNVCTAPHVDAYTLTQAHVGVARMCYKLQLPGHPSQGLEEALAYLAATVPTRTQASINTAATSACDGPAGLKAYGTACVVVAAHSGSYAQPGRQDSMPLIWSAKSPSRAGSASHTRQCLMLLRSKCEARVHIQKAQLVDVMTGFWLSCDQPDAALQSAYKALALKLNAWQLMSAALDQPMELCGSPRRFHAPWAPPRPQTLDILHAWEAPADKPTSSMQSAVRVEVSCSFAHLARAHASRGHVDDAERCIHHALDWDPYSAAAAGVGAFNQLSSHHHMDMLPRTAHLHALMSQIKLVQGAPGRLAQAHLTAALAVFIKSYGHDHELVASTCLDLSEVLLQPLVQPTHGAPVIDCPSARTVTEGRKLLLRGSHWLKERYGVQDVRVARAALSLSSIALHWDGCLDKADVLAESAVQFLTSLLSGLYQSSPSTWFSTKAPTGVPTSTAYSAAPPTPDASSFPDRPGTPAQYLGVAEQAGSPGASQASSPRDTTMVHEHAITSYAGLCVASWQASLGGPDRLCEVVQMHDGHPDMSSKRVIASVTHGIDAEEAWREVELRQHALEQAQAERVSEQATTCPVPRPVTGVLFLMSRALLLQAMIKERQGLFSAASDAYRNALTHLRYVITTFELSAGLNASPGPAEPNTPSEWAWTSSVAMSQPLGALIGQALSGHARLQLGVHLAVPAYKPSNPLDETVTARLRTFSMTLDDLVPCDRSTSTLNVQAARHGALRHHNGVQISRTGLVNRQHARIQLSAALTGMASRREGISLSGLLITRLGSAPGIHARRHAKQALWMLEQSVRLCQMTKARCVCHQNQVLAMQCAQSVSLVMAGGPAATRKAEALARRVLASIRTLPAHQAVWGWTVREADVQLLLSAIMCADAQSCKEALAVAAAAPAAPAEPEADGQKDGKQPSRKCKAHKPKLHHRMLADLSGVIVQPSNDYASSDAALYTQLYGEQDSPRGEVQAGPSQASKASVQAAAMRPVHDPTVVLMLGGGHAASPRPTVMQSLSASASSQSHKALEAARAAYRMRFEMYGSTSEHTVEALAQLAHVTSVYTQRWTIIEAMYKSVLDAMLLPSCAYNLWARPHAGIALSTLTDAATSAAIAGHIPSAAHLVTHYMSVVGVQPGSNSPSSEEVGEAAVLADGYGNVEQAGPVQLQALHARVMQISRGAVKESDEVVVDLCEELLVPQKLSWWKRLLGRKPSPIAPSASKVVQASQRAAQASVDESPHLGPSKLKYLHASDGGSGVADVGGEGSWLGVVVSSDAGASLLPSS